MPLHFDNSCNKVLWCFHKYLLICKKYELCPTYSSTIIRGMYVSPLSVIQIDVLNVEELKSDAAKLVCYIRVLTLSHPV